jgi:hypothetical protein
MVPRALVVACGLLVPACSFVFVQEPSSAELTNPATPLTCTTSRAMPIADIVVGAVLTTLVATVTYAAVEDFNDNCTDGGCYHPWKPALLASFLVASPWGISAAVGISDTGQCRAAKRARAR